MIEHLLDEPYWAELTNRTCDLKSKKFACGIEDLDYALESLVHYLIEDYGAEHFKEDLSYGVGKSVAKEKLLKEAKNNLKIVQIHLIVATIMRLFPHVPETDFNQELINLITRKLKQENNLEKIILIALKAKTLNHNELNAYKETLK